MLLWGGDSVDLLPHAMRVRHDRLPSSLQPAVDGDSVAFAHCKPYAFVRRDMGDPVLARQLEAMAFMLVGLALVGLALYLRLRIFIGTRPGGVDTWYYLASAEAIRSSKAPADQPAAVPAARRQGILSGGLPAVPGAATAEVAAVQLLAALAHHRRRPPVAAVPARVPTDRQCARRGHGWAGLRGHAAA